MNDLISRQAAIDVLDVLCQEHRYRIPGKAETYSSYNEAWQDALSRAENAIGNLPPVQLEQRWIPVAELPKEDGTYIVSGVWDSGKKQVGECEFYVHDGYFRTAWNFDVKAWRPMPELYKGE